MAIPGRYIGSIVPPDDTQVPAAEICNYRYSSYIDGIASETDNHERKY